MSKKKPPPKPKHPGRTGRPRAAIPPNAFTETGERLQSLRESHGLSVDEAAARVGVSRRSWLRWERGQSIEWIAVMAAVCDLLGCEVTDLVPEAE